MCPSREDPSRASTPSGVAAEFSSEERSILLLLAHESIASAVQRREISSAAPSNHLAEPRGVFTTLYLHGQLRGCVGYALSTSSLYFAVAQTARAAAFEDPRFAAMTQGELAELKVSLSILSPLQPIRPEEIEIGRHGLVISQSGKRGLLLPQVPVERKWDRMKFLEQTCVKAGLPADAWRSGAVIEAFTAEVFGDEKSA